MSLNGLFLSFSALCDLKNTFFRKKIKIFFEKKNFPNFSNSCSLNIFEPKIWRRLGTFPSCLHFRSFKIVTAAKKAKSQFTSLHFFQIYFSTPFARGIRDMRLTFFFGRPFLQTYFRGRFHSRVANLARPIVKTIFGGILCN